MLHEKNNLLEMSLRLKRRPPIFQSIREKPGIARRPSTKHHLRLGRNLSIYFMIVCRKSEQTYILRILSAVNITDIKFHFHLLTKYLKERFSKLNGA